MEPAQIDSFVRDYKAADLPDNLLMMKYNLTPEAFAEVLRVGNGTFLEPRPLTRNIRGEKVNGTLGSGTVAQLAKEGELLPADLALSPLEQMDMLTPLQRDRSYALTDSELMFANLVLRGLDTTAAACAAFQIYDKFEAQRKAASSLRDKRITDYVNELKGQNLYAPIRGKQYLEAVLHKVIDRSMEMDQAYTIDGKPVSGRCYFNGKLVVQAALALMKLKGWGNTDEGGKENQLSHVERLRQINLNKSKGGGDA